VLLVMLHHYRFWLDAGWVGVQLFYVLSGFLITRILRDAREGSTLRGYLTNFYVRRSLRILPIYVALIAAFGAMYLATGQPGTFPRLLPWAATYTLNFALAFGRVELNPLFAHLWSLSVEEQFYLVWPFVVWFLGPRALARTALALAVLGPVGRFVALACGLGHESLYLLTTTHLDAFAIGAAVAIVDPAFVARPRRWVAGAFGVAAVLGGIVAIRNPGLGLSTFGYPYALPIGLQATWGYSVLDLVAATVVLACDRGALPWLEHRILVAIGRISYGLYVFHRPLVTLLFRAEPRLTRFVPDALVREAILFGVYMVASLCVAWLSFHLFESRFLALKGRFAPRTDDRTT